jgi:broad specificity phosphatase PhoE
MSSGRRLYIFRHGETDWNRAGRIQGHTDIGLNLRGRAQAHDLAERLRRYTIDAVLTSDLSRARQTAQIVASRLGIPVFLDRRLREASLGQAEGLTVEQIMQRFGEEAWGKWRSSEPSDWGFHFPGGEPKRRTVERAKSVLDDFLRLHHFEHVAISTHGGVIRTLIRSGIGPAPGSVSIRNCAVHVIDRLNGEEGVVWNYVKLDEPEGESPDF